MLRAVFSHRATWALTALALVAVLMPVGLRQSQAAYVAQSTNPNQSFSAAASFNTVAVSLTNPGTPLRGNVVLTASASSSRGIANVVFQTSPAGAGSWTTACTASSAPYSCTWDTTAVGDGLRDVRAVATDNAGYTRSDTVTNRRVDNTAPTATTTDPGSPLTGTVTISGTASDGGSGLAAVTLQYRSSVGTWVDICTTATSPISCAFATSSLADGLYDFRTVASDAAGNSTNSSPVFNRRVDNNAPTVTMTDPGANLKGSVTLQSTSADGGQGSGVASVRYEYKPSAGSIWTTACTGASSPFSCSFNTASVADGVYDFRAIATDGVGLTGTSATVSSRRIDNTAPTGVTLTALPTPLVGTVAMTATALDAGSGVADVKFQYAPTGTSTWTTICTDATSPYTCSFATAGVADGGYDLRALATDNAGNTLASATQTRTLDNNGPTVSLTNPSAGAYLRGTVNVTATANDASGVASVTMQYRLAGAPTWTTLCVAATTPYSCALNTTALTSNSSYEIRLIAADTLANTTTTNPITVTVDNIAPTAVDVQSVNGGTARVIDDGDAITFTWSEPMAPASILAGWGGGSQAIRVKVSDNGGNSLLELYDQTGTTRLNVTSAAGLLLGGDYVGTTPLWLNGTLAESGSTTTVSVGSLISGSGATVNPNATMVWASSTGATDLAGNSATGNTVTESGGNDRDF